jgi:hypothetical protein
MKNHLFVGLGGQGGRSLAQLRKVLEERAKDTEELRRSNVKWDFLSIDSSPDIWNATKEWKYFGKDVSLYGNQKLPMGTMNRVDGLSIRPDVAPWIGEKSVIDAYLGSSKEIPGANQRRRFGRLLFANNADEIRQAIQKQVSRLTQAAANQCWFHLFASLAGGTGSGGIVDLIASIRSQFPNGNTETGFPIFLYLYITHNDGDADVGYFYQNQYAALRDLNALVCDRLRPNLLGSQEAGGQFAVSDPVTQIALFSSLNNLNVNLPLDNQIRIVAESCFERIYALKTGNLAPNSQKALSGEDIIAAFRGEPNKRPEHSYRFGSMGMRRWEVPNKKLEEVIALDLMSSGCSQMLYQNWQEGIGFTDVLVDLTESKLSLVRDSLLGLVSGKLLSALRESLITELRKGMDQILRGVLNSGNDERSLETLENQAREYFDRGFHNGGARAFLQGTAIRQGAIAREIFMEIDESLTQIWKDPASPLGLNQLPGIISALGSSLRGNISAQPDTKDQVQRLAERRAARKAEWQKLTKLSRIVGKDKALLTRHAKDLLNEYSFELTRLCQNQDTELQRELLGKLNELERYYLIASSVVRELKEAAESERDEISHELQEMQTADGANRYEFDLPALIRLRDKLRKDLERQASSSLELRNKVVPEGSTLSRFHQESTKRVLAQSKDNIDNDLRQIALQRVKTAHQAFVDSGVIGPVLNASLLDRLQSRFSGDPELIKQEATSFVNLAASSLHLDQGQTQPAVLLGGGKVGVPRMPKRVMVLGIPKHPYAAQIQAAFQQVIPANLPYVRDIYTHDDVTQLRLLVLDYWMATRFSTTAKELFTRYKAAAKQDPRNDLLYFTNIDPDGEQGKYPSLFLPSTEVLKQLLEAGLWLGKRLPEPIVAVDANGVFLLPDETGKSGLKRLGDTVDVVVAKADISLIFEVESLVQESVFQLDSSAKERLEAEIAREEERIAKERGRTSPEFQKWIGLRTQMNILLG